MANEHEKYELLKIFLSAFGAVTGAVTVGGRIVAALVAREATKIEKGMMDRVGSQFVSREVVETKQMELGRRLDRIEKRLDHLIGRD